MVAITGPRGYADTSGLQALPDTGPAPAALGPLLRRLLELPYAALQASEAHGLGNRIQASSATPSAPTSPILNKAHATSPLSDAAMGGKGIDLQTSLDCKDEPGQLETGNSQQIFAPEDKWAPSPFEETGPERKCRCVNRCLAQASACKGSTGTTTLGDAATAKRSGEGCRPRNASSPVGDVDTRSSDTSAQTREAEADGTQFEVSGAIAEALPSSRPALSKQAPHNELARRKRQSQQSGGGDRNCWVGPAIDNKDACMKTQLEQLQGPMPEQWFGKRWATGAATKALDAYLSLPQVWIPYLGSAPLIMHMIRDATPSKRTARLILIGLCNSRVLFHVCHYVLLGMACLFAWLRLIHSKRPVLNISAHDDSLL